MSLLQRFSSLANDSSAQNRFARSSGSMDPQELGSTNIVELRGPRFVGLMVKNPATGSVKPSVDVCRTAGRFVGLGATPKIHGSELYGLLLLRVRVQKQAKHVLYYSLSFFLSASSSGGDTLGGMSS